MEPKIEDPKEKVEEVHIAHTYKDDLEQAMNVTAAPVVQTMLADAREREVLAAEEVTELRERKWYSISGLALVILTFAVVGYGAYYYFHLTVPVRPIMSVGVFPNTDAIVANSTSIDALIKNYTVPSGQTTLAENKPTLIDLVTDSTSNTLLSDTQLFTFMGAAVPEPLQTSISTARLGLLNTGQTIVPFIIASVPDADKASKEFSNAEPNLLSLFGESLAITPDTISQENGQPFQSQYFYNLPTRTLSTVASVTAPQHLVFLYGFVSNNTIVITTQPQVLKAIHDTIINQS